jgi:serine/threonine protein kinase
VNASPISVFASPASSRSPEVNYIAWTPSPISDRRGSIPTSSGGMRPRMGRRASHDLFEAVEHQRFTEDQAKYIFKQIGETQNNLSADVRLITGLVDAVAYMHERGIYHRDLKDENVVIDRNLQVSSLIIRISYPLM